MNALRGEGSPGGEAIHSGLSGSAAGHDRPGETPMLENITVILLVLWGFSLVSSYTMGGLIHLFLVMAIAVTVIRIFQGLRLPGQVTRSGERQVITDKE
jgi:Family of unknown function (DUF5670)